MRKRHTNTPEKLPSLEHEIEEGERRFRFLADALPQIVWTAMPDGWIDYSNQRWIAYTGLAFEQLEGWGWTQALHPDDVQPTIDRWTRSLESGEAYEMEYRWKRASDGVYRWHLARGLPLKDLNGHIIKWVGTSTDIEDQKQAQDAAERANRAKSDFLASMSHELRTPLNGILGYAQILLRDSTLGERQVAGLRVIQQSGEQLLTLINDVLDFAKIEAGRLELSLTDIPLAKFLRIITEIISVKAEQKGLIFICDTAPDLPGGIRADEKRLRQALLNLLANAVKFTDRGQVSLRVRFLPPTRLRFEVQDTGIGISEDQLESIFHPFEQGGDAQRRLGGSGLGLAISQRFVRLMGGDIQVESRIGQGSTFWFELELPVVQAEMAAPPAAGVVIGYQGPRKKVLIVDDVVENRAVVVNMLGQIGFEMTEAASGREGLEKAQDLQPDLILMDIVMPEMGGLEATRRLRQLPAQKDVPIIAVSASTSGGDQESSVAAGMSAFQPKPIDFGLLLAQIASLLKLSWTYKLPPAIPSQEHEVPGPLLAPPAQEMEILHRLAREGNMRDIVQRAAHLAELDERYRPFAEQLRLLAKGYQSKAILSLVERHLGRSPAP
jgi:PAS domain S-box-containing protein